MKLIIVKHNNPAILLNVVNPSNMQNTANPSNLTYTSIGKRLVVKYLPFLLTKFWFLYWPTFFLCAFGLVCTVEKFPFEKLDCDDSKDELEQHVHDQNVGDILQWVYHTIKHSLLRKCGMKNWNKAQN